eukprot:TRINITY_DN40689_c1_g1_i1.p1 TRINITY_DN40689_c1_g1~~TRINITY_DN40689_c1_g1_i1.p1  ORF type:complete len:100 (-),score=4.98 TRINITY_DN40689_c1_g1_i1:109-408(-)
MGVPPFGILRSCQRLSVEFSKCLLDSTIVAGIHLNFHSNPLAFSEFQILSALPRSIIGKIPKRALRNSLNSPNHTSPQTVSGMSLNRRVWLTNNDSDLN